MTPTQPPARRARRSAAHRSGAVLAAVAVVLGLAGCGTHPGSAAVVGDVSIGQDQVDDAATALCAANISGARAQGQPAPELASRGARSAALQILIDTELSEQYARSEDISPSARAVSEIIAQNGRGIAQLPPSVRPAFRSLLTGFAESQQVLQQAAAQRVGGQVPAEQLLAEGARLRQQWARGVTIDVDPRFGEWRRDALAAGSGSLSVPVSDSAVAGANPNPAADFVADLPASQKCA